MSTATAIINDALTAISCLKFGQSAAPDILAGGLRVLNNMLNTALLDRLMVYAIRADAYTLTAGLQTYTIGPSGATFTAARPTKIEECNVILNTSSPTVRKPVDIVDAARWSLIGVQDIPSAIPLEMWYDGAWSQTAGNATIHLWPGPLAAYQLELFTWQQLTSFADLTTNYTFPPGYLEWMIFGLGEKMAPFMAPYFKIPAPLLNDVKEQARKAKGEIESYNAPEILNQCEPQFLGKRRNGAFNYLTGGQGREL